MQKPNTFLPNQTGDIIELNGHRYTMDRFGAWINNATGEQSITAWLDQPEATIIKGQPNPEAQVILFKDSGKYYTEETWAIPQGAMGPFDMQCSQDFRRIGGGAVLVVTQEPWGYPHVFNPETSD